MAHRQLPINEHQFHLHFVRTLDLRPSVVLLPAKRKLDSLVSVLANANIKPEGTGVLNFLFSAKNQEEGSQMGKQL